MESKDAAYPQLLQQVLQDSYRNWPLLTKRIASTMPIIIPIDSKLGAIKAIIIAYLETNCRYLRLIPIIKMMKILLEYRIRLTEEDFAQLEILFTTILEKTVIEIMQQYLNDAMLALLTKEEFSLNWAAVAKIYQILFKHAPELELLSGEDGHEISKLFDQVSSERYYANWFSSLIASTIAYLYNEIDEARIRTVYYLPAMPENSTSLEIMLYRTQKVYNLFIFGNAILEYLGEKPILNERDRVQIWLANNFFSHIDSSLRSNKEPDIAAIREYRTNWERVFEIEMPFSAVQAQLVYVNRHVLAVTAMLDEVKEELSLEQYTLFMLAPRPTYFSGNVFLELSLRPVITPLSKKLLKNMYDEYRKDTTVLGDISELKKRFNLVFEFTTMLQRFIKKL
jgi:hypothetical protein